MKYTAMVKSALAVALGLVVSTASALDGVFTEDFQSYDIGATISNIAAQAGAKWWAGGEDDTSTIVLGDGENQLLNLNTEGGTVSNKIDTADLGTLNTAIGGDGIALDALVQFVPSDDDKTIPEGDDLKFALFAYGDEDAAEPYTNLVVTHSIMLQGGAIVKTNTVTDIAIDCDELTAVKVTMKKFSGEYGAGVKAPVAFQVKIGDTVVTSANAYSEAALAEDYNGTAAAGGNWFLIASMGNGEASARENIQALALQGTGKIDDIAMSVVVSIPDFFTVNGVPYKEAQDQEAFAAALAGDGYTVTFLKPYTITNEVDLSNGIAFGDAITPVAPVTIGSTAVVTLDIGECETMNDYVTDEVEGKIAGQNGAKAIAGGTNWKYENGTWVEDAVDVIAPVINGVVATPRKAKAVPGSDVIVDFAAAPGYILNGATSATYTVDAEGNLTLKEGTEPTATQATVVLIAAADASETPYTDLATAINASAAGDTVKLLADVSANVTVPAGKDITLDLGGKTLTGATTSYAINNLGTLVISNGNVTAAASQNTLIRNGPNANMTIADGTYTGIRIIIKNDEDGIGTGGTLTINGGTFSTATQDAYNWDALLNWGTATINGGTFNGMIESAAAKNWNAGNLTINGGTFANTVLTITYFNNGTTAPVAGNPVLTVNGGSFASKVFRNIGPYADNPDPANYFDVDADELPEPYASSEVQGTLAINALVDSELNDATFAVKPADNLLTDGYEFYQDDQLWKIRATAPAATVIRISADGTTTNEYATLTAALAADADGDTIKLLENYALTGDEVATFDKDVTFDLGGFTFAPDSAYLSAKKLIIAAGADVVVTNGAVAMEDSAYAFQVHGKITTADVAISKPHSSSEHPLFDIYSGGEVVVNDGSELDSNGDFFRCKQGDATMTVTVNGGYFTNSSNCAFWTYKNGTVLNATINGGVWDSGINHYFDKQGCTLTINCELGANCQAVFNTKGDLENYLAPGYEFTQIEEGEYAGYYHITAIPTYTVDFAANYQGADPAVVFMTNVLANTVVVAPADPTREGYTFGGWFNESSCDTAADFTAVITAAKTFYAKWTAATKDYPAYITDDLKVAFDTWAGANEITDRIDELEAYKDQFLMNIAPDATATLTITSITVDGSDATITIDGGAANLGTINGVLFVRSADTLAGLDEGTVTSTGFTVSEGDATVTIGVGKFFKAYVEVAVPSAD